MSTVQSRSAQEALNAPCRNFSDSRTFAALRSACQGEQQARNLYLAAARRMEEEKLYVIAHAFRFTAAQEKEHAEIFQGLLIAHGGCIPPAAEAASMLLPRGPLEVLRTVARNEHDEWDTLYPYNARLAAEEGYPRIASAFRRIAETEQIHAMRFLQYAKALAEGTLFRDRMRVSWICLPCGQLHTGFEPPEQCGACGRDRGHFIRSNYFPFVVED